jgi:hypothetical protein
MSLGLTRFASKLCAWPSATTTLTRWKPDWDRAVLKFNDAGAGGDCRVGG